MTNEYDYNEYDYDGPDPDLSEDEIHDPLEEGEEPPIHLIYGTVYDELKRRHRQARRDAEDESIETLEAGAQILADRHAEVADRYVTALEAEVTRLREYKQESMERERAWNKATADLIRNHKAEVERLRELVKEAYHDGWLDGWTVGDDLPKDISDGDWDRSSTKKALEGDDE